jgi:hypothetical protein
MIGRISSHVTAGFWPASVQPNVVTGIAAAGNSQATATQLTGDINVVASATATSADGVRLPKAMRGDVVAIYNADDGAIAVWPFSGDGINALGSNAEYTSMTTGKNALFIAVSDTAWIAILSA